MADKAYSKIMSGLYDKNTAFNELRYILESAGFLCRVKGDHFIYTRKDIAEIINIQPSGKMAKPYQVKQVRLLFQKYNI